MIIDLCWSELTSISKIDYKKSDQGVYVWGFMFEEKFIPYYLGIAYNIQTRLTEHVSSIISGKYCIIHSNSLREFYKYKEMKNPATSEGVIYIPNFPTGYQIFLENRDNLLPHINNMIDRMYYSYSSFNEVDITTRKLRLIENKCIESIGKEKLWNSRCGNCDSVKINKITGAKQMVELFNFPK